MRTLKRGCRGNDVMYLQYLIGADMDGSFGPATDRALRAKQRALGLVVDGSCGPKTRTALGLSDFMVWVFDLKKDKLWVAGAPYKSSSYPTKTLSQWAKEEGASEVWNLAFFNMTGSGVDKYGVPIKGRTLTYVKAKGKDVGYGGTAERITLDSQNVFAGYKLAIKDGKKQTVSWSGKRARNANGRLRDGRVFVVQTVSKQTEAAVVNHMMQNYAVDLMLIQDSGGSTGFYSRQHDALIACEREGKNGRPVATVLCCKRR